MAEERKFITEEERRKIEMVKEALRRSDDPDDKLILKSTEDFERQDGMTMEEKLIDISRDNSPYKTSMMQQRFSSIKRIRAVRGSIYIEIDEHDAYKAARLQALRTMGPLTSPEELKTYIAEHMNRSKLLSVPKFVRNLKLLSYMVRKAPQLFGEGTGGSTVRDILEDSRAAIKEALEYLRKHRDTMPPALYEVLTTKEIDIDNKAEFVTYLGDGWEKELDDKERAVTGTNLLLTKNFKK